MEELLKKIRNAKNEQKCQMAFEVFTMLMPEIDYIERHADKPELEMDLDVFDFKLNEMEELVAELERLLSGLDHQEIERIKEKLHFDYFECFKIWEFYELLNMDGMSYTADYGEFAGKNFKAPSSVEVLEKLTPHHMQLYQKMEKEGLEPKLQVTPIGFQIRTLGYKIDTKRRELKINTTDTYVSDEIIDEELQYSPTLIKAVKGGQEIEIKGGKTKSEWIKTHAGFLIDIVPTKEALTADESIQKDQKGEINYSAIRAEKYAAKAKQEGFTPMSHESYLLAQMRALKAGKPLETSTYSLLLDSNPKNSRYLAYGGWRDDYVTLDTYYTDNGNDNLRIRGSVRVPWGQI